MKHLCENCNYQTEIKRYFDKHLLTQKHKNNFKNINNINNIDNIDNINNINNINNIDNLVVNKIDNLSKQNTEVLKQNKELKKKIEHLEKINIQNTNKIVREAREVKKSILTILNTKFKDTPALDYIKEDEFIKQLQIEYKAKIDINNDTIFMRIFRDYEKNHLTKTIADIILKIIIKDDKNKQAVFNIDFARGNFATKADTHWMNDKKGVELKKYTLKVVVEYMIKVLDVFRQRLCRLSDNNNIKINIELMDYFIINQKKMYEVSSFITNPITHTRIIMLLCPELRFDDIKLLK